MEEKKTLNQIIAENIGSVAGYEDNSSGLPDDISDEELEQAKEEVMDN
jgi:hypothetical protein